MFGTDVPRIRCVGLALVLALVAADAAVAQQGASREQEQIRRLRQQLQLQQRELQSAQEQLAAATRRQSELESQRAGMDARLKRSESAAGRLAGVEGELAAVRSERDQLQRSQEELRLRSAELTDRLREDLATRDALLAQLRATMLRQSEQIDDLLKRNAGLHAIGIELLERYRSRGTLEACLRQEPFLGYGQVETENLVQDYATRLQREAKTAPQRGAP
jgi:chromosome segregation ATPase